MEHTFRIAFLLLVLSGCLQGKPTPKLETLQIMLKELKIEDLCPSDSTFYAPSPNELKNNKCTAAALSCSREELKTVEMECTYNQHIKFTMDYIKHFTANATLDCPNFICEDTRFEKPYGKFIENMISLTQSLNSQG